MQIAEFKIEKKFLDQGYDFVIGVDEAGRGPLAGPVVAAATLCRISDLQFLASKKKESELIRDSKTLSEKQREKIFDFIGDNFWIGIGICDHHTIDRINILEATFLAMKKAVTDLIGKYETTSIRMSKAIILVDGNKVIPNFSMEQNVVIGGDKLVKSIAAASIIAKVTRDRIMNEMHIKYPQYGFDRHKGYGTNAHLESIRLLGPCEIHRRSFEPIRGNIHTHLAVFPE